MRETIVDVVERVTRVAEDVGVIQVGKHSAVASKRGCEVMEEGADTEREEEGTEGITLTNTLAARFSCSAVLLPSHDVVRWAAVCSFGQPVEGWCVSLGGGSNVTSVQGVEGVGDVEAGQVGEWSACSAVQNP